MMDIIFLLNVFCHVCNMLRVQIFFSHLFCCICSLYYYFLNVLLNDFFYYLRAFIIQKKECVLTAINFFQKECAKLWNIKYKRSLYQKIYVVSNKLKFLFAYFSLHMSDHWTARWTCGEIFNKEKNSFVKFILCLRKIFLCKN